MRASASALPPSERAPTAAPMNGTNTIQLGPTPSRRIWNPWPYSWTASSATKPAANGQPQISAYAATDTPIEPNVASSLTFGSSRSTPLNFVSSAPSATSRGGGRAPPPPRAPPAPAPPPPPRGLMRGFGRQRGQPAGVRRFVHE